MARLGDIRLQEKRSMEFGMFHEFPSLPDRSESEAFDEAMEQVDAAERLGLDVMWLAELHFEPRRSVLSAPLSIASAIAARTRRMKIGIAVQVLPLCHPLRLAEEAKSRWKTENGRIIERDYLHDTFEVYDPSGRRHLGEFDPWDGRQIGDPDPTRSVEP
jgi:hypothetical protein